MKTTDGGITWNVVYDRNTVAIYFIDENIGWAIEKGWEVFHTIGMVIKTTDGGLSWVNQLTQPGVGFTDLFFTNEDTGWVIGDFATILKTTDAGENWGQQISGESDWLNDVQFVNENEGWIASWNKILYTPNGGGSIVPVELISFAAQAENQKVILKWITATELNNNGFEIQRRVAESDFATIGFVRGEGTTTNQREYSYVDKDLVDGKHFYRLKQIDYNGAYEYSDVIEVDVRSLVDYALEQNFPNPFNPTTTIGYVLKEKTTAKLILLNAIGEEVAVLVNEEQDKGFHKIDFDASELTSGVYFYRLQAGDFVEIKKMLYLK